MSAVLVGTAPETVSALPSTADAASAGMAIAAAVPGVRRICLFGSVARGEAREGSDIDLLCIFNDIDYAERKSLSRRCRSVAEARLRLTGRTPADVGVYVTDMHEWNIRSALRTTLEREIYKDIIEIHRSERPVPDIEREDKVSDKPDSDIGEAYIALGTTRKAYFVACDVFPARTAEVRLLSDDPDHKIDWHRQDRYTRLVTPIDVALESTIKVIHHLIGEGHPQRIHRLAKLVDDLPADAPERHQITSILDPLRVDRLPDGTFDEYDLSQVFTDWRVQGTYVAEGIASYYLPEERVNAYLDAAEQMHDLLTVTLAKRSDGEELWDSIGATQYLEAVEELRDIRTRYDLKTGVQHDQCETWTLNPPAVSNGWADTTGLSLGETPTTSGNPPGQRSTRRTRAFKSGKSGTVRCGAETKSGKRCRRLLGPDGRCPHHGRRR